MPDASSEDELLTYSLETAGIESSTVGARHSTDVLKPTTETSGSEAPDGLVVYSWETTVVELVVVNTSSSTPASKSFRS